MCSSDILCYVVGSWIYAIIKCQLKWIDLFLCYWRLHNDYSMAFSSEFCTEASTRLQNFSSLSLSIHRKLAQFLCIAPWSYINLDLMISFDIAKYISRGKSRTNISQLYAHTKKGSFILIHSFSFLWKHMTFMMLHIQRTSSNIKWL